MLTCTRIVEVRERVAAWRRDGRRIAFVPTMGALHEGHLALVDAARRDGDVVVMSVFVNPLQFRPGEDLARYPRDLARDAELAGARGVDLLFAPTVEEMYGGGDEVRVVAGEVAARWEGAARPGHFDGVLTVVLKLLHIVQPDVTCFGRKDIQQVAVVRQMVRELDVPVRLVVVPTVRDPDGLALSSRNAFLSPGDRDSAVALCRGLVAAREAWQQGERSAAAIEAVVRGVLDTRPLLVTDYIAVVDPDRLRPVEAVAADTIVALAARVGGTRLIDNTILGEVEV